jgi:Skp family chaperone for outer membrane proteins
MDGDTGATDPQAGDVAQPQVGATQKAQAVSAEPAVDAATIAQERDEARREAAKYRTEVRRFEQEREAAKRAGESEQERLQRERQDFERERAAFTTERQDFALRQAVTSAATALGFIDPDDAFAHLDRSAIEWSDDGKPRGLDRQLRSILERKPHLLNPNRTATPMRGVQPSGRVADGNMNALIRQAAGRNT